METHTWHVYCVWTTPGDDFFVYIFVHFFISDYITQYNDSWYIKSTTISVSRKYVLTTRVFHHQDWSNIFNWWVIRPGCTARGRTLFRKGEYVKSDSAPMRRLS